MAGGIDATLVAASAFAVFIGGMLYLKVPGMAIKALDDKSASIANELAEAKRLRAEAEALRQSYEDQRVLAETEAAGIIANSQADAIVLKADAEAQLTTSIATRGRQAEERIRRAEEAALAEVRAAATNAAIATAEKVLVSAARGKVGEQLINSGINSLAGKFG